MKSILILISLLFLPVSAFANKIFEESSPIKAVLTAPISQAYGNKRQDVRLYHSGKFSIKNDAGEQTRFDVKIRTRGNFRRKECSQPPLELNFQTSQLNGTAFSGQDKLKLVNPCRNGKLYDQYLALEYLSYRAFEIITDYSYKTQLLELSFIDSDNYKDPWTSIAFLIESEKHLAKRLGMDTYTTPEVARQRLDLEHTSIMEVFQLMIGNTDYSSIRGSRGERCCHNARLLIPTNDNQKIIPVPYDFDSSGLVNAKYAKPPPGIPISSVRSRYFTGWCKDEKYFLTAVEKFKTHEQEIRTLFETTPLLNKNAKKSTIKYLNQFFNSMNNPKKVKVEVTNRCRGATIR